MKAVFRKSSPTVEFQLDGDMWTSVVGVGVEGMEPKVYKYKMGDEIIAAGIDGAEVKVRYCYLIKTLRFGHF